MSEDETEKKPRTISTTSYDSAAASYLDKLNIWINANGYEPKFNSLDEYKAKKHQGSKTAYEKLKRAYEYFAKGIKPTNKNVPLKATFMNKPDESQPESHPDNQDFSMNQMGEEDDKMVIEPPKTLMDKYYRDRSRGFKNQDFVNDWKASMKNIYGITGKGFNISHNPDYLRKDYFDWVVKKKHPE